MPANWPGSFDSFSPRTDGVDYYMSTDVNQLQEVLEALELELGLDPAGPSTDLAMRLSLSLFESGNSNSETLAGNATLTDTDGPLQFFDPDGSGRDVTLPAIGSANHAYMIVNTGDGGETLSIKDAGAAVITTVTNGTGSFVASDGAAWRPVSSGTLTADGVTVDTTDFGYSLGSTNTTVQSCLDVLDDAIRRTIFDAGVGGDFIYSATDDAPTRLAAPTSIGKVITSGAGGVAAPVWSGGNVTLIQRQTLATTTDQTLTFSTIPQTYKHLLLRIWNFQSLRAATSDTIALRFNGDTGTNYTYMYTRNNGGSLAGACVSGQAQACLVVTPGASWDDTWLSGWFMIWNYAQTGLRVEVTGESVMVVPAVDAANSGLFEQHAGVWNTANAITSLSVTSVVGNIRGNVAGQPFTAELYGIQEG